ncbi:MAG: DUF2807 domain-containing protein [Bacteroidales bacterium]|nr:DUF2807 domain-containing protein [Bacteroidales bacterium]
MKTKSTIAIATTLLICVSVFLTGCDEMISGSGRISSETREVSSFDAIEISGAFHVYLIQGNNESLVIEADDNLLQYIESGVRGGRLYIEPRAFSFRNPTLKAYITFRDLDEIRASGAVKITGETSLEFGRLLISTSGASDIDLELYGERLELKVSGAGKTHIDGEVEKTIIRLSGASKLNAESLYVEKMDINISGAGSANVRVEDELVANISGAGNIRYIGDPRVHSKVSGAGNVKRLK